MATLLLAPVIAGANAFWAAALTMTASAIDNWVFAPKQDVKGQRMDSLQLQESSYGGMIPIAFGRVRSAGNIIFASNFVEHEHKERVGKGGRKKTVTTYTYSISFAVALAKGPITGVGRIWADGKVIATGDAHNLSVDDLTAAKMFELMINKNREKNISSGYNFRIYLGTENQMPDPYMEAINGGPGTTPAYRGLSYIVFQDMDLSNFGNRIPQMQFEIFTSDTFTAGWIPPKEELIEGQWVTHPFKCENKLLRRPLFGYGSYFGSFKNCDMSYLILSSANIGRDGFNPGSATFDNCNLYGMILTSASIDAAVFTNCNIRGLTLVNSGIIGQKDETTYTVKFIQCSIMNFRAVRSTIEYVYFKDCDLSGSDFTVTNTFYFENCKFENCDLRNSIFSPYSLYDCILINCKLHGCLTREPWFHKSKLKPFDVALEGFGECGTQLINCDFTTLDLKSTHNSLTESQMYPLQSVIVKLSEYANIPLQKQEFLGDKQEKVSSLGPEECDFFMESYRYLSGEIVRCFEDNAHFPDRDKYNAILKFVDRDNHRYTAMDVSINSGITQYMDGYLISSQTTFRNAIEELQGPFLFNVVDTGDRLKFVMMGTEEKINVPEVDFGAVSSDGKPGDKLTITSRNVSELPTQINFKYFDIAKDYQTNISQSKILWHTDYPNIQTVDAKIVMTARCADYVVNQALVHAWTSRTKYSGQLGNKWSGLEAADVIQARINGISRSIQLTKIDYDGSIVKFEGKEYKVPGKPPEYERHQPALPPVTTTDGLKLHLLDLPNLSDTDTDYGFYAVAAAKKNWKTVHLYASVAADDSTFDYIDSVGYMATIGEALTTLPVGPAEFFDRGNTVDIKLTNRTLESVPEEDLFIHRNVAILGNEIIQFAQAVLIDENIYRLSCFLRGRRGTEWAIGEHAVGDKFILLNTDSLFPQRITLGEIGMKKRYQYKIIDMEIGPDIDFTYRGACFKPYSVCHVQGMRNKEGGLKINWKRRTRVGGNWRNDVDVELGEIYEKYEIDIIKNDNIVRTIKAVEPVTNYSAADQASDFGSVQNEIKIRIYQISNKVGRGYAKEVII